MRNDSINQGNGLFVRCEIDPIRLIDSLEKKNWKTAKNQLRLLDVLDPKDETKLSDFCPKIGGIIL